ncbi:MAG: hypothetical protein GTO16_05095 [Candidatus Aminicenantes bacterium]|nr:hypothetical protein [Candidatus Aminicenantes bacterium]NIO18172.1 hypothetical protein [bacterium]
MPKIVREIPESARIFVPKKKKVKSDMGVLIQEWWESGEPALAWSQEEIEKVGGERGRDWDTRLNILRGSILRSLHEYPKDESGKRVGILKSIFEGRMPEFKYDEATRTLYLTRPEE